MCLRYDKITKDYFVLFFLQLLQIFLTSTDIWGISTNLVIFARKAHLAAMPLPESTGGGQMLKMYVIRIIVPES